MLVREVFQARHIIWNLSVYLFEDTNWFTKLLDVLIFSHLKNLPITSSLLSHLKLVLVDLALARVNARDVTTQRLGGFDYDSADCAFELL